MKTKTRQRRVMIAGIILASTFALVSCGAQDMVGDSVARNGAAQAGKSAFKQSGHEINGKLSCSTDDKSDDRMKINCNGTTKDGKPAQMNATLEKEAKVVTGDGAKIQGATVTGTVAGQEVFKKDCIGEGC